MRIKSAAKWLTAVAVAGFFSASAALADCEYELFGSAQLTNGSFQITSSATEPFGGIAFEVPEGTTFEELTDLATEFDSTDDTAGGGSPRFSIGIDTNDDGNADGSVFVYLGTPPNFNDGGEGDTGNLLDDSSGARFDLTQLGGPFYGTYSDAVDLVGEDAVTGIALVVDGGWSQPDGEQTFLFDNIRVNGCVLADVDDDNVPDDEDGCVPSDKRPFVDANGNAPGQTSIPNTDSDGDGCTIQDEVNEAAAGARNHGQYVSAIAHLANELRKSGELSNAQANELKTAAARSNIGKK